MGRAVFNITWASDCVANLKVDVFSLVVVVKLNITFDRASLFIMVCIYTFCNVGYLLMPLVFDKLACMVWHVFDTKTLSA